METPRQSRRARRERGPFLRLIRHVSPRIKKVPIFYGALWRSVDFLHKEKRPASLQAVNFTGVPNRIRTGVTAVKGQCPRPLDDGDSHVLLRCFLQHQPHQRIYATTDVLI